MSLDPLEHEDRKPRTRVDRRQRNEPAPGQKERRRSVADRRSENNLRYVTFRVADQLLGILVESVQEVVGAREVTPIPLAPAEVAGFLNLRGQIVTAIDMRSRMALEPRSDETPWMNVIIGHDGELFSLMVDTVGDVHDVRRGSLRPPPSTLDGTWARHCEGVVRIEGEGLLVVIDVESILSIRDGTPSPEPTRTPDP